MLASRGPAPLSIETTLKRQYKHQKGSNSRHKATRYIIIRLGALATADRKRTELKLAEFKYLDWRVYMRQKTAKCTYMGTLFRLIKTEEFRYIHTPAGVRALGNMN
jgi:hypothetical protein